MCPRNTEVAIVCICVSVCLSLCVYLSVNCYLLFILVKSGPWEQGHPSCPWVYQKERKKERTAKGIENTVPLRAARRQTFPTEVTVVYLLV